AGAAALIARSPCALASAARGRGQRCAPVAYGIARALRWCKSQRFSVHRARPRSRARLVELINWFTRREPLRQRGVNAEFAMSAPDPFIITKALDWLSEGRRVALATVIQTWGSAPQPVGSQLLIDADGNFLGSVSGGCVEAEVITEAADVIASGEPRSLECGVEDAAAWKVGLACGGSIRVFVEPLAGDSPDGVLHRLLRDVEA